MASSITFLSNNVKGLQSNKKRLKIIEYLKEKLDSNGFLFLQETHSTENNEVSWKQNFNGQVFFSHGKSNSCGVLICYYGSNKLLVKNQLHDNEGRILILDLTVDEENFVLINYYNPNTEIQQLEKLEELTNMLSTLNISQNSSIIFGGDLNLFFNSKLEASGGNPSFKNHSVGKLIELREKFDLNDIWRTRNPKKKRYTFRQNHASGFLQRRLDYFLISNSIQEFVIDTKILPAFLSDHSPLLISYSPYSDVEKCFGFWKFNNSLLFNETYTKSLKNFIAETKTKLHSDDFVNSQGKWEFFKYEIRKFTIKFSKSLAQDRRKKKVNLEKKLSILENDLNNNRNLQLYNECKKELDEIYENITEGIRVRSRCQWYEEGEKSTKFFLNLEKTHGNQGKVRKIIVDNHEITDSINIRNNLKTFYESLFKKTLSKSLPDYDKFLENIDIPFINIHDKNLCEKDLTDSDFLEALLDMQNNKTPGNDGLTKEFYVYFWNDIKNLFIDSWKIGLREKLLSVSQRQAIIKLMEKKGRDKRYIKNWRPISLLNVDYKICSKALAKKLNEVLPKIISSEQTAYVKNRFIGESGRLISDIIETADIFNVSGYMVTMDIEKAFDSLDHTFLLKVLKKIGFGENFIRCIETITNGQESCIINGGNTTQYFNLERGARQGDPISAYLFIIALEVLFILIKNNNKIEGLEIVDHTFLYTAYADDSTFFLKNVESIRELIKVFSVFSSFSGLKPNLSKCEIAGIGLLKGVNRAVCGMKSVDLKNDSVKILGTHFSYNDNIKNERNFVKIISDIQKILRLWNQRNLSLEGRVVIFKTLAISKLVYLALLIPIPNCIIKELETIQKIFIWQNKKPKIKHETLRMDFKNGGLKNVDIKYKIASLQCSWIQRLYDDNNHDWKIIPKYFISTFFGKKFIFHSNLNFSQELIKSFPPFYRSIFINWKTFFYSSPDSPSCILSEFLWFNKHINIENKYVFFQNFSEKNINFVYSIVSDNGSIKNWVTMQQEFHLENKDYFRYMQLVYAIPISWKKKIKNNIIDFLLCTDHHITRKSRMLCLEKLISKELYVLMISNDNLLPTSQNYFNNMFPNCNLLWEQIYLLPRKVTIDSFLRCFQYKIINNTLFLNKKLFCFKMTNTPYCSFCEEKEETTIHLFFECEKTSSLWSELRLFFSQLSLPDLLPQTALLGFYELSDNKFMILKNHILLLYKLYVYKQREIKVLSLQGLISVIDEIKKVEKKIALKNHKIEKYNKKWHPIERHLQC